MAKLKLSKENVKKMEEIHNHLHEASLIFLLMPNEVIDEVLNFHNNTESLNHCLRWGLQAAEEILREQKV